MRWIAFLAVIVLCACQPAPPVPTALPTFDESRSVTVLCGDVDTAWGLSDWPRVIKDLETVLQIDGQCNAQNPALTLYPAYYNYGAALDSKGDTSGALDAYRHALIYNPDGREAALALKKHSAFTPEPLQICNAQQINTALAALTPYIPAGSGAYIAIHGASFMLNGAPFVVHGINYYPAEAPWRHFLTQTTTDAMRRELTLIQGAGFNTIRIFVWYGALFTCPGSGAVPVADAFARLDAAIQLAAQHGLHVLITLNDLPDLTIHPLYTEPDSVTIQTEFIVARYQNEPAILAWDVRNEGDIDYIRGYAAAQDVNHWLGDTISQVRALDAHHLVTAGWNEDSASTAGVVDFLSFHHWSSASSLRSRADALHAVTHKPILLEEVGYNTFGISDAIQADSLKQVLDTADSSGLAGWIIWDAFDTTPAAACSPPNCNGADNAEYHFGLWHADGSPKQAVTLIKKRLAP